MLAVISWKLLHQRQMTCALRLLTLHDRVQYDKKYELQRYHDSL